MSDKNKFPTENDLYRFAFWEGVYAEEARPDDYRMADKDLQVSKTRWEEYKQDEIRRPKSKTEDTTS